MKYNIILLIGLLALAACTAPPEDIPRATDTEAGDGMERIQPGDAMERIEPGDTAVTEAMDGTVPLSKEKSTFEFEGYGPGKSHIGTFTEGSGTMTFEDGKIVQVTGIIQADSVVSDGERLENHLRSADFFDVENYPTIEAVSTEIDHDAGQITGDLTFLGVTKSITFPATITDDTVSAEFVIDSHEWGMVYTGVDAEVRIAFTFVAE